MAKGAQDFNHEIFRFLHRPLREGDKDARNFLERFVHGPQLQFEALFAKINALTELYDPAKTPQPRLLKDIVGFTRQLDNITRDISDAELRKLIALAVPLWKEKGLEVGYKDIVRLFTGKGVRVFNWFDFRYIVGEQGFGEEQLGEDSWLISVPGIVASTPTGNTVLLLTFEGNARDRSIHRNHGQDMTGLEYYPLGPVQGSERYAHFDGGLITPPFSTTPLPGSLVVVPWHPAYDLSGSFTLECFVRTNVAKDMILFRQSGGGKGLELRYNSLGNTVSYIVSDGVTTVTETLFASADLDDNTWRHVALVLDRTAGTARLWLGGVEATPGESLGALGNVTMTGYPAFVGGASYGTNLFAGDMDNLRLSLSVRYPVDQGTLPVPSISFVEYQEELLDEYKTDIRVVDKGDLNRTLTKRILNLMRPISERLNVIYIRLFEDFIAGKGDLVTLGTPAVVSSGVLQLPDGAIEQCDAAGAETFQDMVLQARIQLTTPTGVFSVRFLVEDASNYYAFSLDVGAKTAKLAKVVGGVETVIGAAIPIDFFPSTFYVLTVVTDFDTVAGETLIKCFQDSNLLFQVADPSFAEGTWALATAGGAGEVSDIEMFLMPLDVETVAPGFNL